jgi:two-component system, LytTR family, response regulator
MKPFRTIHVDDQAASLSLFKKIAKEIKGIELLGSFHTAEEALHYMNTHEVDLAIVDVVMPSYSNGLWLANQLQNKNTAIVFLTAHAEHATAAFEACALDYVLKPITRELLENTVTRLQHQLQKCSTLQKEQIIELYDHYMDESSFPKRLFINTHGQIMVINLKEVTYLKSSSNYTTIKMIDGNKYTSSKHLKIYDTAIRSNPDFLRIHRSAIVNKNYVKAILRKGHKVSILMTDNEVLEVSIKKKDMILDELSK